ncbi:MAG: four helix bundle protein [Anaerolineales bacterium]|nr:four helix bundle protein [Anaerolineales bacterium]
MKFEDWIKEVPEDVLNDPLWKFETYRKALFLSDLAWFDCGKMMKDERGKAIAQQLSRSAGSVAANIEEGYSRGYGKDYARFLRIALGSARESRGWYYRGRHLLGQEVVTHRCFLLRDIISGLIQTATKQKNL